MGAAWATLVCYATMVLLSWALGRRYYPVPYDLKRILGYVALGLLLYAADRQLIALTGLHALAAGTLCLGVFVGAAIWLDGRPLLRRVA